MVGQVDITAEKYELDDTTKKYVTKKVGRLFRYVPRHARKMASADVKLRQVDRPDGNKYEAEILLHVPEKTLAAKDSTVNMLAAVDIVEAKLMSQLHKYKETHVLHIGKRGVLDRFKRGYGREQQ